MADQNLLNANDCLQCSVCGSSGKLKRCARCKSVVYCSREHQVSDWATHKFKCRKNTQEKNNDCDGDVLKSEVKIKKSDKSKNDGIKFDNRPILKQEFEKPNTKNIRRIAKFVTEKLKRDGYCVVDDLFENVHLENTLKEVHELEESGAMETGKLAGGRTSSEESEKVVNANIRRDKLMWMEGNEKQHPNICKVIEMMDDILVNLNGFVTGQHFIHRRTKAMIASYPGNGTYYRRHVDNPRNDGRLITCILYLNKNWDVQQHGGLLRMFPEGTDNYVDIPPVLNRLLFFWSDRRNPHEVQPAYKNRYAITVWYFDKTERDVAEDQVNSGMQHTYGEYALLEVAEKEKEKEEIVNKIETETQRVLGSLSEQELDAIAALLEGAVDPKDVLRSLGISPILQDKLLEVLQEKRVKYM